MKQILYTNRYNFSVGHNIPAFLITWQSPILKVNLAESKMVVRHFGPPPDMGPGPHGKYDWVINVMQEIPNRCRNAQTGKGTLNCR